MRGRALDFRWIETVDMAVKPTLEQDASPLIVRRVDAIPVALPLLKPMLMAGVRIERAENLIVRIEAENGLVGWGEAASAPTMTGDLQAGMVAAVDKFLAPLLVGSDAMDHGDLERRCAGALHHNGGAKAAVSIALLDLAGRHVDAPVHALFGGAVRDSIRPMWLLGNRTVVEDMEEAVRKQAEGFDFFKLKVGVKPVEREIANALALRARLGEATTLCADANTGFSRRDALRYLHGTAGARLLFLEQPLPADDMAGTADLAGRSPTPLGADEAIERTRDIVDYHEAGAVRGVNLKTIKLGGVHASVEAGRLCHSLGLCVNLACKVAESSIGAAALAHIGSVLGNLDWGVSPSNHYLSVDVVRVPVRPRDGVIVVPRAPGLGVEVLEDVIERYRVR